MGGGAGGGTGSSTSYPTLYNWSSILPPWTQAGQQQLLPQLQAQVAGGGLTPEQEASLWGSAKGQIEQGAMGAGQGFSRQMAASGISPQSPAVAGGWSGLGQQKIQSTAKAAMDFVKTKLAAKDTSIGQLLTALYTPAPVATGQVSTQTSNQTTGK